MIRQRRDAVCCSTRCRQARHRFARGDESRHGTSSGLGLAIAAENARLLGGTLTVERDGSTFRLTLPTDGLAPQRRLRDPLGATT